jgi:hypothetical protein
MSGYDIYNFHEALAKQLLPKFIEYKNENYEFKGNEKHEEEKDRLGRYPLTKYELDEIIYALEWAINTNGYVVTKKQNNFYIKYYGKTPYSNYKEKDAIYQKGKSSFDESLVDEARIRAQKGFEIFGKQFTNIGVSEY